MTTRPSPRRVGSPPAPMTGTSIRAGTVLEPLGRAPAQIGTPTAKREELSAVCRRSPVGLVALLTCSLECSALVAAAMLPGPPSDPMPVRAAQVPPATASPTIQRAGTEVSWAAGLPGTSLPWRPNATALDRATPVGSAQVEMIPQVSDPREALALMAREAQHRGHLPCIYPCLMPAIVDHDDS